MNDLPIRWEWDEDKNDENRRKHRISFEVARLVFSDPLAASQPDPFPTEQRRRTIGEVRNVVIIVFHTGTRTRLQPRRSDGPHHQRQESRKA